MFFTSSTSKEYINQYHMSLFLAINNLAFLRENHMKPLEEKLKILKDTEDQLILLKRAIMYVHNISNNSGEGLKK